MPDLVFLEMTNEVPAQIGRQLGNLRARFLYATFAENLLPGFMRFTHALRIMRFCNRD